MLPGGALPQLIILGTKFLKSISLRLNPPAFGHAELLDKIIAECVSSPPPRHSRI